MNGQNTPTVSDDTVVPADPVISMDQVVPAVVVVPADPLDVPVNNDEPIADENKPVEIRSRKVELPPSVKELTESELVIQLERLKEEVGKIIAIEKAEWKNIRFSEARANFEGCLRLSSCMGRTILMYFDTKENALKALDKWKDEGYGDLTPEAVYLLSDKRSFKDLETMQIDKQILQVMGIPIGVTWRSLKPCFPGAARIVINRNMIRHGMAQVIYDSEEEAANQFSKGSIEIEGDFVLTFVYTPYRAFRDERFLFKDMDPSEIPVRDPRITFNPPRRFWRTGGQSRGGGGYARGGGRRGYGGGGGRRRGYRRRNNSVSDSTSGQQTRMEDVRQEVDVLKSDLDLMRTTVGSLAKSLKSVQIMETDM